MINNLVLKVDIVVDHKCLLAEVPVWDDVQKCICWIDILNGEIHQFSIEKKVFTSISVHEMIGSLAICVNGDFIVALHHGFAFVNRKNGAITKITDPEAHLPNNRFNDGKCDPAGRFWAGTMPLNESESCGSVYMMASDLSAIKKIKDVTISNGMAWSLNHTIFYYIDTPTYRVVAYSYDKNTGNITNKKVIIKVGEEDGFPDGMTIDDEGMLWIAHWGGWQLTRWNPKTGKKISAIKLPVSNVTSCTFGGADLTDLYITSAKKGLTEKQLSEQPLAGSLFIIAGCGFKGLPAFKFDT